MWSMVSITGCYCYLARTRIPAKAIVVGFPLNWYISTASSTLTITKENGSAQSRVVLLGLEELELVFVRHFGIKRAQSQRALSC